MASSFRFDIASGSTRCFKSAPSYLLHRQQGTSRNTATTIPPPVFSHPAYAWASFLLEHLDGLEEYPEQLSPLKATMASSFRFDIASG